MRSPFVLVPALQPRSLPLFSFAGRTHLSRRTTSFSWLVKERERERQGEVEQAGQETVRNRRASANFTSQSTEKGTHRARGGRAFGKTWATIGLHDSRHETSRSSSSRDIDPLGSRGGISESKESDAPSTIYVYRRSRSRSLRTLRSRSSTIRQRFNFHGT
jgi:hypothetical protein